MSLSLQEKPSVLFGQIDHALLYVSRYRTVYIGRLGDIVKPSKACAMLAVSLEGELSILNNANAVIGRAKSILIPAETNANFDFHNALVAVYYLDFFGNDLWAFKRHSKKTLLENGQYIYSAMHFETELIKCFSDIYMNKPCGEDVYKSLMSIYCQDFPQHSNLDARIVLALKSILEEGRVDDDIQTLASSVCLSVPRFTQLFKQSTGTTVRRFKLWHRIYLISAQLSKGKSFTDAAIEAGFSDYAHFSRSFSEMGGVSPSSMFYRLKDIHIELFEPELNQI